MGKSVKEVMGLIQLQFIWMSTDKTLYKYANDSIRSYKAHSKWKKFKGQMAKGNYFAVLTETKDAPGSTSGYSYNIIGVLAKFSDQEELSYVSHINHEALAQEHDNWSKLQATANVANSIQKWFANEDCLEDFNTNTHLLLQLIAEGGLKEAKKLAKEFM